MDIDLQQLIAEIIENKSSHGVLVISQNYHIRYVNNSFRDRLNLSVGDNLLDYYGGIIKDINGRYTSLLIETMDTGKEYRNEVWGLKCLYDGQLHWFTVNTYINYNLVMGGRLAVASYVQIDRLKAYETKLQSQHVSIFQSFAKAIGMRDYYTMSHVIQVAQRMSELAVELDMSPEEVAMAYFVGLIHDVGKIGIPEKILNKSDSLTADEYETMKNHAKMGADIVREMQDFDEIADIILYHHERYDGTGYPAGLKGEEIPHYSRMLAICDAYDAMTSFRCYRQPVSTEQAIAEICKCAGSQFDPQMVTAFCNKIKYA